MRFTTFQGEKSMAALLTRVYGELPEARRGKARDALLRANPQLESLRDLPEGAVLVVPPLAGRKVRVPGGRGDAQPSLEVMQRVIGALELLQRQLAAAADAEEADIARTAAALKSDEMTGLLRAFPELREEAERVKHLARDRTAAVAASREFAKEGLEGMGRDLEKLARSLE